jgi:DNA-binding MarR family transcriptional regulator
VTHETADDGIEVEPFDAIAEACRQWECNGLPEPLAMTAMTSIMRAQQLVLTEVDRALRPYDLTFARYEVLMLLRFSKRGALPMTKVGSRLMVHPTGITKLVDKLEAQGLVVREPNVNDRRGTLARITREGREVAKKASRAVGKVRFGLDLEEEDMQALIDVVRRLRERRNDLGEGRPASLRKLLG